MRNNITEFHCGNTKCSTLLMTTGLGENRVLLIGEVATLFGRNPGFSLSSAVAKAPTYY